MVVRLSFFRIFKMDTSVPAFHSSRVITVRFKSSLVKQSPVVRTLYVLKTNGILKLAMSVLVSL